jgi:hypothetical protein
MKRHLKSLLAWWFAVSTCQAMNYTNQWIGWGRWSDRCVPKHQLVDVVCVQISSLNASALLRGGQVVNWNPTYDPWAGKWSEDQIYSYPETAGIFLTNILVSKIESYHGLALEAGGKAFSYPLVPTGRFFRSSPEGLTNIIAIDTKGALCAALRADGKMFYWGKTYGGLPTEITDALGIVLGENSLVSLNGNGTVSLWASNRVWVPQGHTNIVAVDVRGNLVVVLNGLGEVWVWDYVRDDKPERGLTNAVKIAASFQGFAAVDRDGAITLWKRPPRRANTPFLETKLKNESPIRDDNIVVLKTNNVVDITDSGLVGVGVLGNGEPVVNQQPIGRSVRTGKNTHLFVRVGGGWPISLQWRRNGVDIPGATNFIYSIRNFTPAASGDYDVVAKNHQGIAISRKALVRAE